MRRRPGRRRPRRRRVGTPAYNVLNVATSRIMAREEPVIFRGGVQFSPCPPFCLRQPLSEILGTANELMKVV
jgi:hypothetical protein